MGVQGGGRGTANPEKGEVAPGRWDVLKEWSGHHSQVETLMALTRTGDIDPSKNQRKHVQECVSILRQPQQSTTDCAASNNRNLFSHSLEARSRKPRCGQGHAPSGGSRAGSFLAGARITPISALLVTSLSVCLSQSPQATL